MYEYRGCFVIGFAPDERGYECVFDVCASVDGVKPYFDRGKGLPDPAKLLRGAGSQVRWIAIEGMPTLRLPEVARLIDEVLERNDVQSARTGRGQVVMRSTAAKEKRQRRRA